jgi:hypothetical protein
LNGQACCIGQTCLADHYCGPDVICYRKCGHIGQPCCDGACAYQANIICDPGSNMCIYCGDLGLPCCSWGCAGSHAECMGGTCKLDQ